MIGTLIVQALRVEGLPISLLRIRIKAVLSRRCDLEPILQSSYLQTEVGLRQLRSFSKHIQKESITFLKRSDSEPQFKRPLRQCEKAER